MTRVVSLFLPTWSTDRLRRKAGDAAPPAEAPLVLVGREGSRRVVLAADAVAMTAGLRVGMPVAKAQVLVPGRPGRAASQPEAAPRQPSAAAGRWTRSAGTARRPLSSQASSSKSALSPARARISSTSHR